MTKAELIKGIMQRAGLKRKEAEQFVNALTETITKELTAGNKVMIYGFGTFEVKERKGRTVYFKDRGEPIETKPAKYPKFTAGMALKDTVNK